MILEVRLAEFQYGVSMRSRAEIFTDVVHLNGNLVNLIAELSAYPYDSDEPLIVVDTAQFCKQLEKCISGEIPLSLIHDWADAIEFRDEVDFENQVLEEFVFELANPEIHFPVTMDRLKEIVSALKQLPS